MSKVSHNGQKEGCIGPKQHRRPIHPSEGHYDLTEDI